MCTVAAMWSWSISAYLTVSLTTISRAVGVVFCSWFVHRQYASPHRLWWVNLSLFKVQDVPCALLPPGGHWGEERKILKRLCLERLISPHPASKYHDCILGDSLPSAWKAKNKPLSTLSSSHPSAFPFLHVFVSGMTADTSLMTKTINFLAGAK